MLCLTLRSFFLFMAQKNRHDVSVCVQRETMTIRTACVLGIMKLKLICIIKLAGNIHMIFLFYKLHIK